MVADRGSSDSGQGTGKTDVIAVHALDPTRIFLSSFHLSFLPNRGEHGAGARGVRTTRGGVWAATQVSRILDRAA